MKLVQVIIIKLHHSLDKVVQFKKGGVVLHFNHTSPWRFGFKRKGDFYGVYFQTDYPLHAEVCFDFCHNSCDMKSIIAMSLIPENKQTTN